MRSKISTVMASEWSTAAVVFVVSLLGHLPWLSYGGPHGWDSAPRPLVWDEGTVLHEALRVANGEVMYRDFFAFQGPVFAWLTALAFRLVAPTVEVAAGLQVLINAVTALLLTVVVVRVTGHRLLGLASGLIYATLVVPAFPYAYPHWTGAAFSGATLVALLPPAGPPGPVRLVVAGACCALGVASVQSLGLVAIGGCAAVFFSTWTTSDWRSASRSASFFAAGGLGVAAVIALFFASHHALSRLVWSVFVWPLDHYRTINQTRFAENLPDAFNAHAALEPWLRLPAQAGSVVLVALPLVALGGGLVAAAGLFKKAQPKALLAGWVALTGVAPLYFAGSRRDVVHLAFLGAFGLVGFAAVFSQFVSNRRAASGLAALVLAFALSSTVVFGWKRQHTGALVPQPIGFKQAWSQSSGWAPQALSRTAPGQGLVVGVDGAGGFAYFFSQTRNATSFTYLPFGWRAGSDYLSAAQWAQAADEILERQTPLLVLDDDQWNRLVQARGQLAGQYTSQGSFRTRVTSP